MQAKPMNAPKGHKSDECPPKLKLGTLAEGYSVKAGEIGVFSSDASFLLSELVDQGVVDAGTFGLAELEHVLDTTPQYQVIYAKHEAVEYWLPDIRKRISELIASTHAATISD